MQDSIKVSPVGPRRRGGSEISVYSDDPVAYWQDQGTYAKRGAAKSARTRERRRSAGIGHAGVKPLKFFRRGLAAGWPGCERALFSAIGRARPRGLPPR
jgi:hypothetical protein